MIQLIMQLMHYNTLDDGQTAFNRQAPYAVDAVRGRHLGQQRQASYKIRMAMP